jgi:hypothetical protein
VVDPNTGLSFAFRSMGDVTQDLTKSVVECSYGAAVGVATSLRRITTQ